MLSFDEREIRIISIALALRINQLRKKLLDEGEEEDSRSFADTIKVLEKINEYRKKDED